MGLIRSPMGFFRRQFLRPSFFCNTQRPGVQTRAQKEKEGQPEDRLPQKTVDIIRGLVEEGALSKAAKHLVSRGVADAADAAIATSLRNLHPSRPPLQRGEALPSDIQNDLLQGSETEGWDKIV